MFLRETALAFRKGGVQHMDIKGPNIARVNGVFKVFDYDHAEVMTGNPQAVGLEGAARVGTDGFAGPCWARGTDSF